MLQNDLKITFARNLGCTDCPLWEGVQSVCVPTREHVATGKPEALLIVGEAPGGEEDAMGMCFVGPTGHMLKNLYSNPGSVARDSNLWELSDYADVYFTNAVRCRPSSNSTPTKGQFKACSQYMKTDFELLSSKYKRITVLCVGTVATQAILGRKVTDAIKHQATWVHLSNTCPPARVFSTFHPAVLLPGRDPSKVDTICDHLRLLVDYLKGTHSWALKDDFEDPIVAPEYLPNNFKWLALDIETYGAIEGFPDQTHFHPKKSELLDGIPKKELVRTVGIAYTLGGDLETAIFVMSDPNHRKILGTWLRHLRNTRGYLLGMNLKFDLMYLRYAYPELRRILDDKIPIVDISVLNYLHNEQRPERSLKDLARLFGITPYSRTIGDGKFASDYDLDLWRYNVEDCLVSVLLRDYLCQRILEDYGEDTPKLSAYSRVWYSELLWTSIYMSETGVAVDLPKMQALGDEQEIKFEAACKSFQETYGMPLIGKGSAGSLQEVFEGAAQATGLLGSKQLALTPKLKRLKTDKRNSAVLLTALDRRIQAGADIGSSKDQLLLIQEARGCQKILGSYLRPMLSGRGKNGKDKSCMVLGGQVYPDWYPVPSNIKDGAGDVGGTIQCRITCRRPAIQTSPQVIKDGLTTRFDPGFLYVTDLSQIELRIAGLLSGDSKFREVYERVPDLHTDTAKSIFGDDIEAHEDFAKYRHAAKTVNFLMLFKGGGGALQTALLDQVGFDWPLNKCYSLIAKYQETYPEFIRWQAELIREANRYGYLQLPMIGASRLFRGSFRAMTQSYTNAICNLPIQATAANIMISAQGTLIREFRRRRMKSVSGLQIYDSVYVEGPITELTTVRNMAPGIVTRPKYLDDLFAHLGVEFPILADETIYIKRDGVLKLWQSS